MISLIQEGGYCMIKEKLNENIISIVKERIKEELIDFRIPYIFVNYDGRAKCNACGYETTKNAVLKNNSSCPACGVIASNEHCIRKTGATLVVEKTANDIIVFRFLTIDFHQSFDGFSEDIKEEFRIYCDQNSNCSVYRLNANGKYAKFKEKSLPYTVHYNSPDVLGHHIFINFSEENDFVQSLDFLFDEEQQVSDVFTNIIQSAKLCSISEVCDDFISPFPSTDELIKKYTGGYAHNNYHTCNRYGKNYRYDVWCGKCGKYIEYFSERPDNNWEITNLCKCKSDSIFNRFRRMGSVYIDVERHSNCTMLRFVNYSVIQFIDTTDLRPGVDTVPVKSVTDLITYYAVFYDNGKCMLFNEDKTPIIEGKCLYPHHKLANTEIIETLKQYPEIENSGFIGYGLETGNWTGEFILSFGKTEVVKELSDLRLFSLIKSIIRTDIHKIPVHLLKKQKFILNTLSTEQLEDLSRSSIDISNLISYIKVLKKDDTAKYSDFEALVAMSAKSCIDEIFRRIPNAKMSDIKKYIEDRKTFECCYPQEAMQIWSEYLNLANKSGYDMRDFSTIYPNNLKVSADVLKRNCIKYLYKQASVEEFAQKASLMQNLKFASNKFSVHPILTIEDYHTVCDNLNFPTLQTYYAIDRYWHFVIKNDKGKDIALMSCDGINIVGDTITNGSLCKVVANGDIHIIGGYRNSETTEYEDLKEFVSNFCAQNCIG